MYHRQYRGPLHPLHLQPDPGGHPPRPSLSSAREELSFLTLKVTALENTECRLLKCLLGHFPSHLHVFNSSPSVPWLLPFSLQIRSTFFLSPRTHMHAHVIL